MNRVAALSEKERKELFTLTAEQRGMGTIAIVEKDFWVCWTLKHLFEHPELSKQLIFKGGTSLSKVYGLVDRFSEDISAMRDMIFGRCPSFEEIITSLTDLEKEINKQ